MSSVDNAALVRRWFDEVWNQRREETIDELLDPDAIGHHENELLHGKAGFREYLRSVFEALPDLEITVENVVVQGDQVVAEWLILATHEGELLGVPPSHKKAEFED
jgi:predicted ester cyclase